MRRGSFSTDNSNQGFLVERLPKKIRILCLDGGGYRGIIALLILSAIEKITHRKIRDMFDVIAGTSTGGIIAMALAKGKDVEDVIRVYKKLGAEIFDEHKMQQLKNVLFKKARFSEVKLEKQLKDEFKEQMLIGTEDYPKCFVVATASSTSNPTPFLFRTYENPKSVYQGRSNCQIWQALRATSAAPTYFQEMKLGDLVFKDGGMVANNPTRVAINEATSLFPESKIDLILSIGTGLAPASLRNTSTLSFFHEFIQSSTDSERVHEEIKVEYNSIYYRLNPPIESLDLSATGASITSYFYAICEKFELQEKSYLAKLRDHLWSPLAAFEEQKSLLIFNEYEVTRALRGVQSLKVIAVYGRVGQGKSTLLNLLLKREALQIGVGGESQTRGITMLVDYRSKNQATVYLDTEGTGKDDLRDKNVISLVFSISNIVIYNFLGKFDGQKVSLQNDLEALKSLKAYMEKRNYKGLKDSKILLLQRDKQDSWQQLSTLVASWDNPVAELLSQERCYSLPPPKLVNFTLQQLPKGEAFAQKLGVFQHALEDEMKRNTSISCKTLLDCWKEMWKFIADKRSFNTVLPTIGDLIMNHRYRCQYEAIITELEEGMLQIKYYDCNAKELLEEINRVVIQQVDNTKSLPISYRKNFTEFVEAMKSEKTKGYISAVISSEIQKLVLDIELAKICSDRGMQAAWEAKESELKSNLKPLFEDDRHNWNYFKAELSKKQAECNSKFSKILTTRPLFFQVLLSIGKFNSQTTESLTTSYQQRSTVVFDAKTASDLTKVEIYDASSSTVVAEGIARDRNGALIKARLQFDEKQKLLEQQAESSKSDFNSVFDFNVSSVAIASLRNAAVYVAINSDKLNTKSKLLYLTNATIVGCCTTIPIQIACKLAYGAILNSYPTLVNLVGGGLISAIVSMVISLSMQIAQGKIKSTNDIKLVTGTSLFSFAANTILCTIPGGLLINFIKDAMIDAIVILTYQKYSRTSIRINDSIEIKVQQEEAVQQLERRLVAIGLKLSTPLSLSESGFFWVLTDQLHKKAFIESHNVEHVKRIIYEWLMNNLKYELPNKRLLQSVCSKDEAEYKELLENSFLAEQSCNQTTVMLSLTAVSMIYDAETILISESGKPEGYPGSKGPLVIGYLVWIPGKYFSITDLSEPFAPGKAIPKLPDDEYSSGLEEEPTQLSSMLSGEDITDQSDNELIDLIEEIEEKVDLYFKQIQKISPKSMTSEEFAVLATWESEIPTRIRQLQLLEQGDWNERVGKLTARLQEAKKLITSVLNDSNVLL